jgi:DNA-binding HxlR family transcriptional regulator
LAARHGTRRLGLTPARPPRVEFQLTATGRALEQQVRAITTWAEQNIARITRARNAYDRRTA